MTATGSPGPHNNPAGFATTRWSLVQRAGGDDSDAPAALAELCAAYWYPVYAFIRQRGVPPQDAADTTQGFFALLLERNDVRAADPERGRFRSFLMTAAEHFLANQRRAAVAEKRGGGRAPLSLDVDPERAEERYQVASSEDSPQEAFDRAWAEEVLTRVLERLREEYRARGQADLFDQLRGSLWGTQGHGSLAQIAEGTGRSPGALRVASHQMRRRYGELLRFELAQTLVDSGDVEEELLVLRQSLTR